MARGGFRAGAGRKPKPKLVVDNTPTNDPNEVTLRVPAEPKKPDQAIQWGQMLQDLAPILERTGALRQRGHANSPFRPALHPPAAMPAPELRMDKRLAMDDASNLGWASGQWAMMGGGFLAGQGVEFLGFPYLSELAQLPEYRVLSETIGDDATRKWGVFDVTGDETEQRDKAERRKQDPMGEAERDADPDERTKRVEKSGKGDKIKALKDDQARLEVKKWFFNMIRDDGFFGRSHLYYNFGDDIDGNPKELVTSVGSGRDEASKAKVSPERPLRGIKTIEAVWTYPMAYNATNPLKNDWYNPQVWYVMGQQIDISRLRPFIAHPVPDMLKPAYSFGGISLSQMAQPYIDIWLRTRNSVAAIIHSFSVMVLNTDMSTVLQPGGDAANVLARAAMFNMLRDNNGLFMTNMKTEKFENVAAPLGGLHELQSQAQEHLTFPARIPLVKLTGIQPAGLNASSEGEIRVYYDTINGFQVRIIEPEAVRLMNFEQLSLFGDIDPEITWRWEPLWEMSWKEMAEKQKDDAERDQKYVDMGALWPGDVRKRITEDPMLPFANLDPDDVPDLKLEEEEGLEPMGGRPQPVAEEGGGKEGGSGD